MLNIPICCPLKKNIIKKNKKTKNGSREKAWPLESYTIGFLTLHTNVNF